MNLETESLIRYLATDTVPISGDEDKIENVFKQILQYPKEGWSPTGEPDEFSMLDPGMVLGRMFCAQLEFEMTEYLDKEVFAGEKRPPFPWILRVMKKDWNASEVFAMIEEKAPK